jgi:4a-hydroxytetrahydrobiopterin dehydratase
MRLTGQQVADEGLVGWTLLLGVLQTRVQTPDFATGLALVNAIGAAAEERNHHPDLTLRYTSVDIHLTSHDTGGITKRDVHMARVIAGLVADAGLTLAASGQTRLELGLDTPDFARIAGFWGAMLGMRPRAAAGDDLMDPHDMLPGVWFQQSGSEEPRQRWHPDIWIDPAEVQTRIDAALAAGGTLVTDEYAPSFWVLADPEGNRGCLCTWQQRG